MKNIITAALLLLGALSFVQTSFASLINGDITISGDFTPTGGAGLGTATGIDFIGDDFGVDAVTGDFALAGISQNDSGTITDFTFNPTSTPVNDFFSIGGFSFTLQNVNVYLQNDSFLILSGYGAFTGNGFEATEGFWNLTANQNGSLFNFSSGVTTVPEPGSLALLGLGLLGLGLARKRKT